MAMTGKAVAVAVPDVMRRTAGALSPATVALLGVLIAGCATTSREVGRVSPPVTASINRDALLASAAHALQSGDAHGARNAAEQWLAHDMRSAHAHLLLGAAYQLQDDATTAELAGTGFESAQRLGAAGPWPHYLLGIDLLRQQRAQNATEAFARAVIEAPDAAWAHEGLAAAAYLAGDIVLAREAAMRAHALDRASPVAWRNAVLTTAGSSDPAATGTLLANAPATIADDQRRWVGQRADALLRTALLDDAYTQGEPADGSAIPSSQQLTVDVVLILGDVRRSKAHGVNLLDALTLQFGRSRQYDRVSDISGNRSGSTSIAELIRIPDITYNLNILNRGHRWYDVIARPSLSAFLGEQSTFFVGEQLNVAVSGVNFAQLEKIDVGVGLKITPADIRADGARFRVEAERSFFSDQGVGSFSQQLATFKQNVAATADVRYGETLVLSGLSESVSDGNESGVPVLGDIPLVKLAFNRKTDLKRERSVIILVTPSAPLGFVSQQRRGEAVQQLLRLWGSVIEPGHGIAATADRLSKRRFFSRGSHGDVQARDLRDPMLMREFLAGINDVSTDFSGEINNRSQE